MKGKGAPHMQTNIPKNSGFSAGLPGFNWSVRLMDKSAWAAKTGQLVTLHLSKEAICSSPSHCPALPRNV